ncbi:MAG: DUF4878 domain-containing protein [Chitinophagaceae bacterium]|nr:DUF4878 domain-containing protein [Chitinophagaceae bacterium]
MRSILIFSFLFLQFFCACNNNSADKNEAATSENDVDAARNFIRSALDNDFEKARAYIINDTTNNEYLDAARRQRARLSRHENLNYHKASIRIYDTRKIDDSTSVIVYSNSYKNQKDSVKVVRLNGQWLIDLKYSFPSVSDSVR